MTEGEWRASSGTGHSQGGQNYLATVSDLFRRLYLCSLSCWRFSRISSLRRRKNRPASPRNSEPRTRRALEYSRQSRIGLRYLASVSRCC